MDCKENEQRSDFIANLNGLDWFLYISLSHVVKLHSKGHPIDFQCHM